MDRASRARQQQAATTMFTSRALRRRLLQLHSRPLDRLDAWLLLAMGIASLLLYLLTAARTVTGEDAGELLAAAHGFGVPHPPGYPLWLILAWAADHGLPFGTVAWRVSLVSAIPSALANTVWLALALKTIRSRLAATVGAALFAVSLTHWTQAVIPEVYGLNTLFIAVQALLLVRLAEAPSPRRLLLLAFVTGISATNHTSALPIALLVIAAAIVIAPGLFRRVGVLAGGLALGALPVLLYLVLPLASARQPYADWGHPKTLPVLLDHVTRAQYTSLESERQAADPLPDRLGRMEILAQWGAKQFATGWVWVLVLIGFLKLLRRQTALTLWLFLLAWLSTIAVIRYATFSFDREHVYANQIFWIPAWMACAWFLAGGIDAALDALRAYLEGTSALVHRGAGAGAAALLVVLVALPGARHFRAADRSDLLLIEDYGRALLDVMDHGALYFPSSDHSTFSVLYQQGVLGYRTDVVLADKYGQVERDVIERVLDDEDRAALSQVSGEAQRRLEEAILIRKWPAAVYFANKRDMTDVPGLQLEPVGPLFQVMTKEAAQSLWAPAAEGARGLSVWARLGHLLEERPHERVDFTVQMVQGELLYMQGFAQLRAGHLDDATATWSRLAADLAPLRQLFNNIGSALAESGRMEEAVTAFGRALDEDPEYVLALRNLALVHRERQNFGAAIETLQRLVHVDPDRREARLELAQLLDGAERPIEALAQYEALAVADPQDPRPWALAGELLARRGDRTKAEQSYEQALRLDPADAAVAVALDRLRQGLDAEDVADPLLSSQIGFDEDHAGLTAQLGPNLPGVPGDPAAALRFDPLRGVRPAAEAARP